MGQHDGFLDRMTARLGELERGVEALRRGQPDGAQQRDLATGVAHLREQLQALRRMGADLTEDATRSYAQAFERVNAALGRARVGAPAA